MSQDQLNIASKETLLKRKAEDISTPQQFVAVLNFIIAIGLYENTKKITLKGINYWRWSYF